MSDSAQGPDFEDGPDSEGFRGPRPWNGFSTVTDVAKDWTVTVEVGGQRVLCITEQMISGLEYLSHYVEIIRTCAENLLVVTGIAPPDQIRHEALEDAAKACDDEKRCLDGVIARCRSMQDKVREREYTAARKCCHFLSVVIRLMKNPKAPARAVATEQSDEALSLSSWPERIWLQHSEDGYPIPKYKSETDEITWNENQQYDCDVAYIRADLMPQPALSSVDHDEIDTIKRLAQCGSVDSFLSLSDDEKRKWFAIMVDESSRRKEAEQRIEQLEAELASLTKGPR